MSIRVEESIEIAAPADRVWDLVMDPHRHDEWVTAHREARGVPDRDLRTGDSYEQRLCLAGRSFDVEWTLVESEEPRVAVWSAEGPKGSRADVRYELSGSNGTTRFDYLNEFELPGGALGRVGKRVAGGPARRQARKSLRRLKSALEG